MKIRSKINISFLTIFVFVSALVGVIVGFYTTNFIKGETYAYLRSSNRAKAEHIRTFLQDQMTAAKITAASAVYRDFLEEPTQSPQYSALKTEVAGRLTRAVESNDSLVKLFILSRDGKIIASSDLAEEGEDKSTEIYFLEGQKEVYVKDIHFSESGTEPFFLISAPIKDEISDNFLGIYAAGYKAGKLYSIIQDEGRPSTTEESFLVNKDKFFITPSRFWGETVVLNQKVETAEVNYCFEPAEMEYVKKNGYSGLADSRALVEAKDYRQASIIAAHAYIPETGWCLVTKADKADLISFRNILLSIFFSIFINAGFLYVIIGLIISRKITNPIRALMIGVKKIEAGDFNYQVDVKLRDEVGDLAKAFNKMVQAANEYRSGFKEKVEEQTKELSVKTKELEDQKSAILNILEDVEKEKARTEQLARDLEKFKLAVDNASDHIVITDPNGIILYANRGVERITGFSIKEIMGRKVGSRENWGGQMDPEVYKNLWRIIKEQKKVFIGELKNRRKGGEIYEVKASISPVLGGNGEVLFFVWIERDITREKEVDQAKTEFVSLASHQLRTPLSAINWYAEMLIAGDAGKITKKQKDYLADIYKANQRMVVLINALLNVSRIELGTFIIEPTPTDLIDVAKSVLNELAPQIKEKKQTLNKEFDKLGLRPLDSKLVRIVLQNLLSNAVKYTPEGGKISISIKKIGQEIRLTVGDTGLGIPKEAQGKIFSKLFRADNAKQVDAEGTGLGLYLVKAIVDNIGGKVWFESKENKGATFYVTLPSKGMKEKRGTRELT